MVFPPQDFDEDYDRVNVTRLNCRELFADIVGCGTIISQVEKYQRIVKNMRTKGKDPRTQVPFNFLFKGPPGKD